MNEMIMAWVKSNQNSLLPLQSYGKSLEKTNKKGQMSS